MGKPRRMQRLGKNGMDGSQTEGLAFQIILPFRHFLRQKNGCRDNGCPLPVFTYDSGLGDIPTTNDLATDFPELSFVVPTLIFIKFHTQR
jgi:hypothetical protein